FTSSGGQATISRSISVSSQVIGSRHGDGGAVGPRPRGSGSGLKVDLFALGATLPHVVTEMRPERRPGLRRGDAHFARRLRAAPHVFGDLAGAPRDHHTALVVAKRGNGTQTLLQ